jgi:hypothetical protein
VTAVQTSDLTQPAPAPGLEQTATRAALETIVYLAQQTASITPMPTQAESVVTAVIAPAITAILPTATPALPVTPFPSPMAGVPLLPEEAAAPPAENRLPIELIIGSAGVMIILVYGALYWRGLSGLERYAAGFIVERCPTCGRGHLYIDAHQDRMLGIPRARLTVRCDTCRSVLRQAGPRRWRYAVDRSENPALYERFNGRLIGDETLRTLSVQSIDAAPPTRSQAPGQPSSSMGDESETS